MVFSSNQNASSSARSLHSHVHDAASVARDRLQDVVSHIQRPETRNGLRDSWDSLVKVMFAPCAGDIGGIPREEMGATPVSDLSRSGRSRSKGGNTAATTPSWGASVPFEVSASQDKSSSFQASSFVTQHTQQSESVPGVPAQRLNPLPQQAALTPRERSEARSRAKLRQLGAQHQLASGHISGGLADAARPVSPRDEEEELAAAEALYAAGGPGSPDLVDFDDGISAISSHTLEEMERRRQTRQRKNVVRLHPQHFTQIVDEDAAQKHGGLRGVAAIPEEGEETNTEVVFGEPFYEDALLRNVRAVEDSRDNTHLEFSPASDLERVTSQKTRDTTVTEESHEFEEMYRRHEAMYWTDQDQVAHNESNAKSARCRPSQRMSIEERARRLRELSRSRSRSDGTGSSNKSGGSSLVSGQHPHDTVPVFSSDLFTRRKKKACSSSGSGRTRRSHSRNTPRNASSLVKKDSDPFASLDYGEI